MKDTLIVHVEYSYKNIYNSFFNSIAKQNKYFKLTEKEKIYIVNNGTIDMGVILTEVFNDVFNISIFQAPNVCRLSIIALIESALIIAKQNNSASLIVFKLPNASSYSFKFKMILKEYEEYDDFIRVSKDVLDTTPEDIITFRKIVFSEF